MDRDPTTPYSERLRRSLNPTRVEFWGRFAAGTALATLALHMVSAESKTPFYIEHLATPDRTVTHQEPSGTRLVPSSIAPIIETGPSLQVSVPQEYAQDFSALPLDSAQGREVTDYITELQAITAKDPTTTITLNVTGLASDESRTDAINGDANLGSSSPNNQSLATQRGDLVVASARDVLDDTDSRIGIDPTRSREVILSRAQTAEIDAIAERTGLSRQDLITKHNTGELAINPDDQATLTALLDANRGARIDSVITRNAAPVVGPCDEVYKEVEMPGAVTTQKIEGDDGWRINFFPGFIPPLPFRRRKHDSGAHAADNDTKSGVTQSAQAAAENAPSGAARHEASVAADAPKAAWSAASYARSGRHSVRSRKRREREANDTLYPEKRRNRIMRRLAGVALAGAALFPWPSWTTEEAGPPVTEAVNDCVTKTVQSQARTDVYVSLPVVDAVDNLIGDHLPPTKTQIYSEEAIDKITYTSAPSTIYKVDEHGKIIDTKYVPPGSRTTYEPSEPSK